MLACQKLLDCHESNLSTIKTDIILNHKIPSPEIFLAKIANNATYYCMTYTCNTGNYDNPKNLLAYRIFL